MFEKILVALDGSERSDHALKAAASLAASQGSQLILLHVLLRTTPIDVIRDIAEKHGFLDAIKGDLENVQVVAPPVPAVAASASGVIMIPSELLTHVAENYLTSAEKEARDAGVIDVTSVIGDGQAGREVLAWAEDKGADLIVLGSRGFGDVKSIFLGSVSHKVAQESKVPCLIVK